MKTARHIDIGGRHTDRSKRGPLTQHPRRYADPGCLQHPHFAACRRYGPQSRWPSASLSSKHAFQVMCVRVCMPGSNSACACVCYQRWQQASQGSADTMVLIQFMHEQQGSFTSRYSPSKMSAPHTQHLHFLNPTPSSPPNSPLNGQLVLRMQKGE